MNQTFRKIISFFLLAVFLVASTPDDLLHLFACHHDTIDSNSSTTTIGIKHIHCGALQLSLPAFSESSSFHLSSSSQLSSAQLYFGVEKLALPFFPLSPSGRAPPALA